MKKIVLSIFGIFVLAACGGDVYQEADRQIELNQNNPQNPTENPGGNTVFTYDPGLPGNSVPGVPGTPGTYESPFSVTAGSPIMYHLINNTPYQQHTLYPDHYPLCWFFLLWLVGRSLLERRHRSYYNAILIHRWFW